MTRPLHYLVIACTRLVLQSGCWWRKVFRLIGNGERLGCVDEVYVGYSHNSRTWAFRQPSLPELLNFFSNHEHPIPLSPTTRFPPPLSLKAWFCLPSLVLQSSDQLRYET